MDQAASTDQIIFRDIRECGEEPDLDCSISLRADCHPEKGAQAGDRALHHFTDFEPCSFLKKHHWINCL